METTSPTRGRPRKHVNNAVKQKQYRLRKQAPTRRELKARILRRLRRQERSELAPQIEQKTIRELKWLDKIMR